MVFGKEGLADALDRGEEDGALHGFAQIIGGPKSERTFRGTRLVVGGDNNDRNRALARLKCLEDVKAVETGMWRSSRRQSGRCDSKASRNSRALSYSST